MTGEQHDLPSQRVRTRSDYHINTRFPIADFFAASFLVSAAYITRMRWPSATRAEAGGVGVGVRHHTVYLHQCVIWIIGPVTDTNHSLSVALAQAPRIQISFHLSGKLKPGELTRNAFPILHQQFGQPCRGYTSCFEQGAQTICLRCITLDPKERQNWPRQRATKTRLIGTLQFHSDTAQCNEVTHPSYPSSAIPL